MAFLERFKGRTNHLTREGLGSMIGASSTPINKKSETVRAEQFASIHKENQAFASPQTKQLRQRQEDLEIESIEGSYHTPKLANSKSLRLRTSDEHYAYYGFKAPTDSFLYDRKYNTGQYNLANATSPKNKELVNTYTTLRGPAAFRGENESVIGNEGLTRSLTHNRFQNSKENTCIKLRSFLNDYPTQNYQNFHDNSPYAAQSAHERNFEGETMQEARLSKFSFIERQEQMISKYTGKMKPGKEEENGYKNSGMNYSPEKSSKIPLFY